MAMETHAAVIAELRASTCQTLMGEARGYIEGKGVKVSA